MTIEKRKCFVLKDVENFFPYTVGSAIDGRQYPKLRILRM